MVKRDLILIFFFFSIRPCLAQELASSYKPKNRTERLIVAKIRALPEVRDFFKYVKKGKPDFIINPPNQTYNNCYAMQVGTDYSDVFRTNFWLLIDPNTFRIYYEDFDDAGSEFITLQEWRQWRKMPGYYKPHKWVKGKLVVVGNPKFFK